MFNLTLSAIRPPLLVYLSTSKKLSIIFSCSALYLHLFTLIDSANVLLWAGSASPNSFLTVSTQRQKGLPFWLYSSSEEYNFLLKLYSKKHFNLSYFSDFCILFIYYNYLRRNNAIKIIYLITKTKSTYRQSYKLWILLFFFLNNPYYQLIHHFTDLTLCRF